MLTNALSILIAYLFGSISSAIIVCRLMGLPDPRTQGSNNPGTTNVLRLGGKKAALITLLGDALKGFLPLLLAHTFGVQNSLLGFVAIAAVLGHMFPIFFGFKGGKGVATMLGIAFGLNLYLGCLALLIWSASAALFRYSSLAALITAAVLPIAAYLMVDPSYTLPLLIITALIFFKHQANIKRLLTKTEPKLGEKNKG